MNKEFCKGIDDLLALFENSLSPAQALSAKLISQVSVAITKERIKLGMTQQEFADYIEVKQSQVSRWEHGEYNFSIKKIAEIASKLNLDVNIALTDMSLYGSLEDLTNYQALPKTTTIRYTTQSNYKSKSFTKPVKSVYKEEYIHASVC